ncbi:Fungalysin/Thermolysin Extracellular metalloproteinase 5 [Tulasnella sp. 419]|nr:Fungalysin/Thermolysin Extracellular metalloproteinase 5 [Tulasnella sp. 419]
MRTERPSCYLQAIFCLLLTQGLQRVAAHAAQGRRSLTYYPVLPNIRYETNPPILTNQLNGQLADPMEVASLFVEGLHGNSVKDLRYRIRKDSYTDASTGITHVYVTQIVGDLEVVDAVMNIHVRDGKVITFGDSFYAGLPAEEHTVPAYRLDSYSNYCRKVNAFAHSVTQQSVSAPTRGQSYHKDSNCDLFPYLNTFAPQFTESTSIADPRHAALLLSIIAHPRETQALQIVNTYDAMFDALRMEVAGEGKYFLHGIPGTLDPVEAKLVYVQQPVVEPSIENEGATALTMGWRIVMDLQDNWYEAVVNARDPTHIISVVDWVSDAAVPERGSSHEDMHSRDQRPKHASRSWVDILRDPFDVNTWISSVKSLFKSSEGLPFIDILCIPNSPTYRVWRWGTNDPESGSRSSECSPRDTLTATNEIKAASPLGWHTIPNNKVPGSRSNATDPVKFTTTFGNNVFAQENWSGGFSFLNNFRPDAGAKMEFNWE